MKHTTTIAALFTAGLGTLIFHVVTGGQIPIFLASSFAFIAPVIASKGKFGMEETLGGLMAAAFWSVCRPVPRLV